MTNSSNTNGRHRTLLDREVLERYADQANALEAKLWTAIREGEYEIPVIVLLGASIAARATTVINLIKDPTYRVELHSLYTSTFWEIHNDALARVPKLLAQAKLAQLLNEIYKEFPETNPAAEGGDAA